MDQQRFCDNGPCPSTHPEREVLMHCPQLQLKPGQQDTLACEFGGGSRVNAAWDDEGQTASYMLPKDVPEDSESPALYAESGRLLCAPGSCTLRRRCAPNGAAGGASIDGTDKLERPSKNGASLPPGKATVGVWQQLSWSDRLLSLWIIGAMGLGLILGKFTDMSEKLDTVKVDTVSLPIALGLWLMMWPVLTKVKYEVLGKLLRERGMLKQVALSLVLNWLIGPALMTGLAWATLPDLDGYRNGVILVGLARCIAMVLLWNQLARGHAEYCAVLVAINSIMQIVLYSPLAIFYIKVVSQSDGSIDFSFWDVARSVLIYLGAPLVLGIITRYSIMAIAGRKWLEEKFLPWFGPVALLALIYTVLVLFGLQAKNVLDHFGDVCRVAVPMFLYFMIMWTATLLVTRKFHSTYEQCVTQSFTASSNNFELAIAIAVGTFGVNSQEALAATIGPLIEVPVLLALVYVALWLHQKLTWFHPVQLDGARSGALQAKTPK